MWSSPLIRAANSCDLAGAKTLMLSIQRRDIVLKLEHNETSFFLNVHSI